MIYELFNLILIILGFKFELEECTVVKTPVFKEKYLPTEIHKNGFSYEKNEACQVKAFPMKFNLTIFYLFYFV